MELFEDDLPENDGEIQDLNITTTILYFSEDELITFKKLAKIGIKKEFGQEYQQKGNLSDFLLKILIEKYGSENTEA